MLGGEQRGPLAPRGQAHEDRAVGARGVHHRERVGGELRARAYASTPARAVGAPVAAPVEGHDAAVAGEVRDLRLPVARVDDRPRRQQQDGRLAVAVDLVEDAHAVALDEALLVGVAGARLLARAAPRRCRRRRVMAAPRGRG